MAGETWIRVPVGADAADAARWATRGGCRRVLFVVHNVTSATRLLDVLPLFHDDFRVQLLATCTGSSPFQAGVAELLADTGVPVLPWEQAVHTPVDLAISASYGGQLHRVQGRLAVLSHGAGYNKRLATPDTGHRTPDTGHSGSAPKPDEAPVFGLSGEWLLHDGRPFADATVLSHPEQLARLRRHCPQAADTAVLAGDPCFDRLLAARERREQFRRAFGVAPGQRLVLLNSTWNPDSLFGDAGDDVLPALLPRLTSELPLDDYRFAAVLHPNIWYGHGPGQVRAWLHSARRAGLVLADPLDGWRQALLAADLVLGDQGSVTYYGAALGLPVLLGAGSPDGLDPDSPVGRFVRTAPRLRQHEPLEPQFEAALRAVSPAAGPAEGTPAQVTSAPGRSAALLRRLFYGLLGLPEPAGRARLEALSLPEPERTQRTVPLRVLTVLRDGRADDAEGAAGDEGAEGGAPPEIRVARFADPSCEPHGLHGLHGVSAPAVHTALDEAAAEPELLASADVLLRYAAPDDPRLGPPEAWAADVLARHPHCALAACVTGPGQALVRTREGRLVRLTGRPDPLGRPYAADPGAYVSALHAWLADGRPLTALTRGAEPGMLVRTGRSSHPVAVAVVRDEAEDGRPGRRPGPSRG